MHLQLWISVIQRKKKGCVRWITARVWGQKHLSSNMPVLSGYLRDAQIYTWAEIFMHIGMQIYTLCVCCPGQSWLALCLGRRTPQTRAALASPRAGRPCPVTSRLWKEGGCDSPAALAFPVSLCLGIEGHAYFTLSKATAQHRKMWPMSSITFVYKDFILRRTMNMSNSVRNQSEGLKK